jgi:hypothetical protein
MENLMPKSLVDVIREKAEALVGAPDDFNSVLDLIGECPWRTAKLSGPALEKVTKRCFTMSMFQISFSLGKDVDFAAQLRTERLERAIDVIYRPEIELISHYFHARLPDQFDAVLHYDHTRAVEPLERTAAWETGEVEETFPSGL